jgi:hypothetical protein
MLSGSDHRWTLTIKWSDIDVPLTEFLDSYEREYQEVLAKFPDREWFEDRETQMRGTNESVGSSSS